MEAEWLEEPGRPLGAPQRKSKMGVLNKYKNISHAAGKAKQSEWPFLTLTEMPLKCTSYCPAGPEMAPPDPRQTGQHLKLPGTPFQVLLKYKADCILGLSHVVKHGGCAIVGNKLLTSHL